MLTLTRTNDRRSSWRDSWGSTLSLMLNARDRTCQSLESLKQILEALQLKGLLHSNPKPSHQQIERRRSLISDYPLVVTNSGPRGWVRAPLVGLTGSEDLRLDPDSPLLATVDKHRKIQKKGKKKEEEKRKERDLGGGRWRQWLASSSPDLIA